MRAIAFRSCRARSKKPARRSAVRWRIGWNCCIAGSTPVPSPYQVALDKTGDVATFAKNYTAFTRAFSESSLREGLFRYGKGDAAALADRFYASMQDALVRASARLSVR